VPRPGVDAALAALAWVVTRPPCAGQAMVTAFNDKDTTFGNGINIAGANHEVHRFYEEDGDSPALALLAHPLSALLSCACPVSRASVICRAQCSGHFVAGEYGVCVREQARRRIAPENMRPRKAHARLPGLTWAAQTREDSQGSSTGGHIQWIRARGKDSAWRARPSRLRVPSSTSSRTL
jgi:hypothetical protein